MDLGLGFRNIIWLISLLLFWPFLSIAQNAEISGKIFLDDGRPAVHTEVYLKDTQTGGITNNQGDFKLENLYPGDYILVLSHIRLSRTGNSG